MVHEIKIAPALALKKVEATNLVPVNFTPLGYSALVSLATSFGIADVWGFLNNLLIAVAETVLPYELEAMDVSALRTAMLGGIAQAAQPKGDGRYVLAIKKKPRTRYDQKRHIDYRTALSHYQTEHQKGASDEAQETDKP